MPNVVSSTDACGRGIFDHDGAGPSFLSVLQGWNWLGPTLPFLNHGKRLIEDIP